MSAPLIVTAEMGAADLAWLDGLRRRHFPPERNQLAAHLTIFHAVPALLESELRRRLAALAAELPPPRAAITGVMDLGGGVAFRIVSEELDAVRAELAEALRGSLTQQDSQGWRPHVTIQNKVAPKVARALVAELERGFSTRPLAIAGLAFHYYEGGPWRLGPRYAFRGR
ncbi:MAG: 2'-5' RNA ligase family protein [Pseudomonadota bacterium]|nr:2'-5' RNA ligase family protein [Pseudomonadota bacterium]